MKTQYKFRNSPIIAIIAMLLTIVTACEEFVTIDPPQTTLSTVTVFNDESTARAAVNRIYIDMMQSAGFAGGATSLNTMAALAADEMDNYSNTNEMAAFASNEVTPINVNISATWNQIYNLIYQANAIREGLKKSTNLNGSSKNELDGEAQFMHAYLHFLLVSFWGDVPWIESTDYQKNAKALRQSATEVYEKVIAELLEAKEKLPLSAPQQIRPTKNASAALLARVYLYVKNYMAAEQQATEVIDQFQLEPDLNNVFLIESKETVFQLQSIVPRINTWDGESYIILSTPQAVALSSTLINAFEPDDLRKSSWTNTYTEGSDIWSYPFKYKVRTLLEATSPKTEYQVILRSGELYLIRAEARANLDNLIASEDDLNAIRSRASLPPIVLTDKINLLLAIEQERRVELFSENGHRWLDLKRTARLNAVIGAGKPNWQPTDALFPIPQTERNRNNNLTQNPGY
ncbi:MAG: RagB/SusD family nutrient uptake outer membrane protein [Bacteroidetes bacterium]|jgi:hypothetical protein|nr:RagB/SusD family nutrient uptake outer membrane protein [Bacteroidota bacterium]